MKKALVPALVLVLTSVVLGATVFREQVAKAAPGIQDVFVTNSTREPVPVHEQGTADVNVTNSPLAVHEQGTADVNVTNGSLRVTPEPQPAAGGGGSYTAFACPGVINLGTTVIASALQIAWLNSNGAFVKLHRGTSQVAHIFGPAFTGERHVVLPLTRPIAFDGFICQGSSDVVISWVGNG